MKSSRYLLIAVMGAALWTSCSKSNGGGTFELPPPPDAVIIDNDPLLPGNPTNATTTSQTNYLKDNGFYKIAYHRNRGIPVWVGWHLQSEDVGTTPRQDNFRADDALPGTWYHVETTDYNAGGFDRGHNCPSGDRTSSVAANSSTFLMTNMVPQAPNMNQGPWEQLEDYTRTTLVGGNKEAYIYTGNYGSGGVGTAGNVSSIGNGNVTVPKNIWKMIMILPKGNGDLSRIHSDATILVIDMPNDNTLYSTSGAGRDAWRNYITTIDTLELRANTAGVELNLLRNVHDSISTLLKKKRFQ